MAELLVAAVMMPAFEPSPRIRFPAMTPKVAGRVKVLVLEGLSSR
jgi:hypothetical protein